MGEAGAAPALLTGSDKDGQALWCTAALPGSEDRLRRRTCRTPRPTGATYTEDVQQDGSMLSLLIGEQVCGELVNCWKTRGRWQSVSCQWEVRLRGRGVGAGPEAEVEQGRGGGLRALVLVPLAWAPSGHSGARCASASICHRPSFGPEDVLAGVDTATPVRGSHCPGQWVAL